MLNGLKEIREIYRDSWQDGDVAAVLGFYALFIIFFGMGSILLGIAYITLPYSLFIPIVAYIIHRILMRGKDVSN